MSRGARHRRVEDEFYRIMTMIENRRWKQFARKGLRLASHEVDDIETDHARDVKEQKYQMLSLWQRRNGRRATLEELEKIVHNFNCQPPRSAPANQNVRTLGDIVPEGDAPSMASHQFSADIGGHQESQSEDTVHHRTQHSDAPHESLVHTDRSLSEAVSSNNHPTTPKLPSSGVEATTREVQRLNINPNAMAAPFMHMMAPSNIRINVTGQNAIGIQNNNIFVSNRSNTRSPRPRHDSTETAKYCDKVESIEVTSADFESYESHFRDGDIYRIANNPKGVALIVNNSFRGKADERKGSEKDVHNLEILLQKLGFEVFLKTEFKAAEINETLSRFAASTKVAAANVVAVFIMSHGGKEKNHEVFYGADRDPVRIGQMLKYFNNKKAPRLIGVPKLFFIQSCRGTDVDMGVNEENAEQNLQSLRSVVEQCNPNRVDASDTSPTSSATLPTVSDMMVSYATQGGQRAFRNIENGSWYINAIVNIFMKYAHKDHILDLMTKVNRAVAAKSVYNPDDNAIHGGKSMSDANTSLRKKLFLFPGFPQQTGEEDF